jgi:EAL domain-containing protein (putative c-di-GMP-specific phosphodiesterase class I)
MIFERAHADFLNWRRAGIPIPKISVNVSSRRLYDPELGAKLATLPIEPGTMSFELLESIFLDDCDETVLANLQMLRRMGIDIEIDDFGTGHASIVGLLRVKPARLKIAHQLVLPITRSRTQRHLVQSIIDIGKALGIGIVAEGVETMEHARILRELGCDVLQGYAVARPMDAGALLEFLRKQAGETPR